MLKMKVKGSTVITPNRLHVAPSLLCGALAPPNDITGQVGHTDDTVNYTRLVGTRDMDNGVFPNAINAD